MSITEAMARPKLKALLGSNGVLTDSIKNGAELREVVKALFEIDALDMGYEEIEAAIDELGRPLRRALVRKNLGSLPARLVSMKPAHKRRRMGVLRKRDRKLLANG